MARSEPYREVLAGVFRKALFHRFAAPNPEGLPGPKHRAPATTSMDQAFSTIMRPRISICSA